MRGYRWQLLALVFSGAIFVVVLFSRFAESQASTEQPVDTPTPTMMVSAIPPTPTEISLPTSTPIFTDQNVEIASAPDVPTFHEALVGSIARLNPLHSPYNEAEQAVTSLIFEGLVGTNAYGEPIPVLASEWIVADNRIEYVFRLRENIQWHDGTPFTSRDVAYTVEALATGALTGVDAERRAFWQTIETQVLGEHLIRFRLAQPYGGFLSAMTV